MLKMKLLALAFLIVLVRSQDSDIIEETTVELCGNGTEESCDAFNSTEVSSEPTTVVTTAASKKTTSKKPKPTTAKSVNKMSSAQNGSNNLQQQPDCTCDVTRGGCEVNCCCDVDCSDTQRAVFTRCAAVAAADDMDCIPPQLLFRSNSDHQTVTSEGLLCVTRQNTHVSTDYRDVAVVRTLAALKAKIDRQKHYSWSHPQTSLPVFDPDNVYKDGSSLWISDNTTIKPLAIPTSGGFSTQCSISFVPKYLVDVDTSCTMHLRNKTDCLAATYFNFTVISSPRNFNFTGSQDCTEDVCLPLRQFLCTKTCVEGKIPSSSFKESSQFCVNVIESIEYRIYHNGSQGLVEVKAFYRLRNFTVHEDQLVKKHHRVTYRWAGDNGETLRVSGHPGYKKGRPVISGRKLGKTVKLNSSETEWMSVAVAGLSGHCVSRHNLMFRENLRSSCVTTVSGTCKQIQQQLWQAMLGPGGNLSEMVVSAYGDPRVDDMEAWVPLVTSDLPPLPSLVSAVDIVVLHTLVGPVSKPLAKIIGVFLSVLPSEITCVKNLTEVVVKMSVKFVDKTVAPVTKFAPPPVYEIKLPQDFFYPFLSSRAVCLGRPVTVIVLIEVFFMWKYLLVSEG